MRVSSCCLNSLASVWIASRFSLPDTVNSSWPARTLPKRLRSYQRIFRRHGGATGLEADCPSVRALRLEPQLTQIVETDVGQHARFTPHHSPIPHPFIRDFAQMLLNRFDAVIQGVLGF